MKRKRFCGLAVLAVAASLAGCGGGASGSGGTVSVPPKIPITAPTTAPAIGDDWTTYAHDYARSADQAQNTGISASSVANLKLQWSTPLNDSVFASPLVYGGLVIVVTHTTGTVYALNATTGAVVWSQTLGGQVRMTPTIADGMLIVGTHLFTVDSSGGFDAAPSSLYALDLTTGKIDWQTPVPGTMRGSPLVLNGTIYSGIAGGDWPTCIQGGLYAFDEISGAIKWRWIVDKTTNEGGSSWSPVSTDGQHIFLGTGNTCGDTNPVANGVVALNQDGSVAWSLQSANATTDDDTGGGIMLNHGLAFAINKNGTLYALNQANGSVVWSKYLGAPDGLGGYATATTDGTYIYAFTQTASSTGQARVASSVFFRKPSGTVPTGSPQGVLYALDTAGNVKWSLQSQAANPGYVAINGGVLFADLDDRIVALNPQSGTALWSYTASGLINASPAVVPSGVYTVDSNGVVYKFALP